MPHTVNNGYCNVTYLYMKTTDEKITVDWEALAKRLIAANHLGIRIEQDSGHRWIFYDRDADHWPARAFRGEENMTKEYGSYQTALDFIDQEFRTVGHSSLLEVFNGIDHLGGMERRRLHVGHDIDQCGECHLDYLGRRRTANREVHVLATAANASQTGRREKACG